MCEERSTITESPPRKLLIDDVYLARSTRQLLPLTKPQIISKVPIKLPRRIIFVDYHLLL